MPYIDLAGLSRYASRQKERLERDCALLRDMQWTRSEKAGAVSLWPAPSTPLEPTVDFLFTEVPPVSGDKGPENPSMIMGVENVTVGNILNLYCLPSGYSATRSGVTCTVDSDGVITLNGTCTAQDSFTSYKNDLPLGKAVFPSGTTLYMKMVELGGSCTLNGTLGVKMQMSCPRTNGTSWYPGVGPTLPEASDSSSVSFKILSSAVVIYSGAVYNNYRIKAQFNINEPVPVVESQIENLYTTPLGSTYYGGTLDAATGVMTVSSQKVTMDGSCSYVYLGGLGNGTGFVAVVVTIPSLAVTKGYFIASRCACNKFPVFSTETPEFSKAGMFLANPNLSYFNYKQVRFYLSLDMLGLSSSATQQEVSNAAKDWFTANPVDAVFTFAEPFSTVQLTPTEILSLAQTDKYTPRLNTIYTDAQAVQVGYIKSPIREEQELMQAVAAQGGNV